MNPQAPLMPPSPEDLAAVRRRLSLAVDEERVCRVNAKAAALHWKDAKGDLAQALSAFRELERQASTAATFGAALGGAD